MKRCQTLAKHLEDTSVKTSSSKVALKGGLQKPSENHLTGQCTKKDLLKKKAKVDSGQSEIYITKLNNERNGVLGLVRIWSTTNYTYNINKCPIHNKKKKKKVRVLFVVVFGSMPGQPQQEV